MRAPYNVNRLGQVAALAALDDPEHWERTRRWCSRSGPSSPSELARAGLTFPPSQANFFLVKVPGATAVRERLLRAGLVVRDGAARRLPRSPAHRHRHPRDQQRLLRALDSQ